VRRLPPVTALAAGLTDRIAKPPAGTQLTRYRLPSTLFAQFLFQVIKFGIESFVIYPVRVTLSLRARSSEHSFQLFETGGGAPGLLVLITVHGEFHGV